MEQNNKTEQSDNKNNTNEIRITLMRDPNKVEDTGKMFAEVTVSLPTKYKDYQVVGVSHRSSDTVCYDVYGNESFVGDYDFPLCDFELKNSILRDIREILNASLVNQKQNDSMFSLVSSIFDRNLERAHNHSAKIRRDVNKPKSIDVKAKIEEQ